MPPHRILPAPVRAEEEELPPLVVPGFESRLKLGRHPMAEQDVSMASPEDSYLAGVANRT